MRSTDAATHPTAMAGVVAADWSASAFLRSDQDGSTRWCFLSDLETSGIPHTVAVFLRDVTARIHDGRARARSLGRRGMDEDSERILALVGHLEGQRLQNFNQYAQVPSERTHRGHGQASPTISGRELAVAARHIEGKGLGLVALRDIAAGECLLCEAPLVTWELPPVPNDEAASRNSGSAPRAGAAQLDGILAALSDNDRCSFYELCDMHEEGTGGSNAFTIHEGDSFLPVDDGSRRSAVFRTSSRINHACAPSCHAAWNPSVRMQTVHALRAIARGEELTIAYLDGVSTMERRERLRQLETKYNFRCDCSLCVLSSVALEESESRRQRMSQISARIFDAPSKSVGALASTLCELTRSEGLPLIWQRYAIMAAMRAAKEQGDVASALRWAERGAECAKLSLGADAPVTTTFEMVAQVWRREMEG